MTTTRRPRGLALASAVALVGLAVAGCSSSGGDADGGSVSSTSGGGAGDSADTSAVDAPAAENAAEAPADDTGRALAVAQTQDDARKLVSTANVQLKAKDVAGARFEVQKVVDAFDGEVEQNDTETDDDGAVLRSRMVLRIPTASFDEAMERLEDAAVLISSTSNTKDVTTAVLDTDIRVRIQRESIQRISLLLDRATSIRDIVSIEAQLSQRQADLASLEQQQKLLADQTEMSTIKVSLQRIPEKKPGAEEKDDDSGFLSGLSSGWHGLTTFGSGLATVTGAVLPFLAVVLVLAIPGWPLLRRLRRRAPVTSP